MKKVRAIVVLMSTPMSWAASRSSAVERMARPIRVLDTKIFRAIMRPMARVMTKTLIQRTKAVPT
jgi:hypothetical protein